MATQETQKLDSIIASRRSLMLGGGALAALALTGSNVAKAAVPATIADADILNFALNLEYLEAQFYTLATEGVTADKSSFNPITVSATAPTPIHKANPKVTFSIPAIGAYAFETAVEERNHVTFLQGALAKAAVDQPAIDLQASFTLLGTAIGKPTFDPFTDDLSFLLGAFIFEDVGVTAYHGGAGAITDKGTLTAAVGIHAVEAYHAGLVRYSLYNYDSLIPPPGMDAGMGNAAVLATKIANLRATLDGTFGMAPAATDTVGLTGQDDFGLTSITVPLNGTPGFATTILDTGRTTTPFFSNYIGFARTLAQVLNIVYADTTGKGVPGGFFPKGLNGNIS